MENFEIIRIRIKHLNFFPGIRLKGNLSKTPRIFVSHIFSRIVSFNNLDTVKCTAVKYGTQKFGKIYDYIF